MITLVFLLCSSTLGCASEAPPDIFLSEAQCHDIAARVIETNSKAVQAGELPPHMALYKCVNWGDPA